MTPNPPEVRYIRFKLNNYVKVVGKSRNFPYVLIVWPNRTLLGFLKLIQLTKFD